MTKKDLKNACELVSPETAQLIGAYYKKRQKYILLSFLGVFIFFGKISIFLFLSYQSISSRFEHNDTIDSDKSYQFYVLPVNSNDPFMDGHIVINFDTEMYDLTEQDWGIAQNAQKTGNSYVNVFLDTDNEGFSYIKSLGDINDTQDNNGDYMRAKVISVSKSEMSKSGVRVSIKYKVLLKFPFAKYMSDEAIKSANKVYNETIHNSEHMLYARVKVNNGKGFVDAVYVDDMTLEDFLRDFEE